MKRLENKIAIITGGAQGIGKATVKRFAEEGATVIIWDVNEDKANSTIAELKSLSDKIEFQKVDVTNLDSVTAALLKLLRSIKRLIYLLIMPELLVMLPF